MFGVLVGHFVLCVFVCIQSIFNADLKVEHTNMHVADDDDDGNRNDKRKYCSFYRI